MAGLETALGAILSFAFEQLLLAIKDTKARCNNFKSTLDSLENKINSLTPKIKEMDRLNQKLGEGDNPKEEILLFAQQLEKARKLVALCSKLKRRNIHKKFVYKKRLDELDSSLDKLLIELMAAQAVDVKRIMAEVLELDSSSALLSTMADWGREIVKSPETCRPTVLASQRIWEYCISISI